MTMKSTQSGLDRWNKRYGANKRDEEIIRAGKLKQKTEMEVAKEIVSTIKKKPVSTEDIFAVIARDSIGTLTQMWANNVQNTIIKTVREDVMPVFKEEIRATVREVVQEELADAVQGIMRGIVEGMMQGQVSIVPQQQEQEPVITPQEEEEEVKEVKVYESAMDERISNLIIEAHKEIGPEVYAANKFKKVGSKFNSGYQAYMRDLGKQGKPTRGVWKLKVAEVLNK